MTTSEIVKGNDSTAAGTVREGFGEHSVEKKKETSSTALAAKAQAETNARYIMALQRPRDMDNVRSRLLRECERPGFSERAFYSLPRGNKPGRLTGTPGRIEGLSVRFAEASIRLMGNVLQQTSTLYDDDFKRVVRVSVADLETNAEYAHEIVIEKTVERSKPKDGAVVLGKRTNSAGNDVYILQCTDDELLQKESALNSKTYRTLALALLPADIKEECERRIVEAIRDRDRKDPDSARKALADSFGQLGVLPSDLKEYLGHDLGQCSAAELIDLRGLYAAIRDGDVSWAEAFAEKTGANKPTVDAPVDEGKAAAKTVAERIKERQTAKAAPGGPYPHDLAAPPGASKGTHTTHPAEGTKPVEK